MISSPSSSASGLDGIGMHSGMGLLLRGACEDQLNRCKWGHHVKLRGDDESNLSRINNLWRRRKQWGGGGGESNNRLYLSQIVASL